MLPYWLLFFVPTFLAFSERASGRRSNPYDLSWPLICLLFTIFICFRYQVGGDWGSYERQFLDAAKLTFNAALLGDDSGYVLLNWLVAKAGFDITAVNVVCAVVFTWGLVTLAREQPRPWLAITIAVPYLVTVVAMGYSRQAVAIGFVMLAFSGLGANSAIRFAIWITVAALFHKSAVVLIPIAILAKTPKVEFGRQSGLVPSEFFSTISFSPRASTS